MTQPAQSTKPDSLNRPSETEAPEQAQWQPKKHRLSSLMIFIVTLAALLLALYAWNLPPFNYGKVYTNNAYVRGNVTVMSPRVGGYVQQVLVQDFDKVQQGQALVEIDPAPYQAKVAQAKANLLGQQAALDKNRQDNASALAASKVNQAMIESAQAQYQRASREWQRISAVSRDAVSQSSRDAAQAALKQAEAALVQAREQYSIAQDNIKNAEVGREAAQAAIDNAKALLDLAEQDLQHTVVYAPENGRLGEIAVKKGQLVSAGTQLMFLVPPKRWVIANIKEEDTEHLRIGQRATVAVDALGGQKFKGNIVEIAPATASEFSIIKADSGTGNFVKIAQRIAVKIELESDQDNLDRLLPGMSVEVTIETR